MTMQELTSLAQHTSVSIFPVFPPQYSDSVFSLVGTYLVILFLFQFLCSLFTDFTISKRDLKWTFFIFCHAVSKNKISKFNQISIGYICVHCSINKKVYCIAQKKQSYQFVEDHLVHYHKLSMYFRLIAVVYCTLR